MDQPEIVEVYSTWNAQEAELVKYQLEDAGIDARVVGDMLQSAAGGLPPGQSNAVRIWVRKPDEQRAREIVAAWDSRPII